MRKYGKNGQKILGHINKIMKKHYGYLKNSEASSAGKTVRSRKMPPIKERKLSFRRGMSLRPRRRKKNPTSRIGDISDRSYSVDQNASYMFYKRESRQNLTSREISDKKKESLAKLNNTTNN